MQEKNSDVEPTEDKAVRVDPALVRSVEDIFKPLSQYASGEMTIVEGRLLTAPDNAYPVLKERFASSGFKTYLQEDDAGRTLLILAPRLSQPEKKKSAFPWLNLGLFVLTLLTTIWAGAAHQDVNLWAESQKFAVGLPYALALMLILGFHESGHYFTARAYGMKVTLPYFIPVPFALGTFGAFIQMKSSAENRRALFDVGVSGPLAGLLAFILLFLILMPVPHAFYQSLGIHCPYV